jgi:hypothetical protein
MTNAAPDFPSLWAEAVNMVAYLKNRLPHKHLPSSTTPFERFHGKRPTISPLKPFGSKCYVHIREEERSSGSKHLPRAREAIIVGYTSSPQVYRVFTLEDEYVFTTRDLTFPKKTSPHVATTPVGFPRTRNRTQDRLPRTKDQRTPLQLHLFTLEFLLKILYLIKIGVGTYSSIPMRQSHSTMLAIPLLVG